MSHGENLQGGCHTQVNRNLTQREGLTDVVSGEKGGGVTVLGGLQGGCHTQVNRNLTERECLTDVVSGEKRGGGLPHPGKQKSQ